MDLENKSIEELIEILDEMGYPLEKLREYVWFKRAEENPDISLDNKTIYSQGIQHEGQEYLVPGVATPKEMRGSVVFPSNYLEEVPDYVTKEYIGDMNNMDYLGQPWGIPVKDSNESNMLGALISRYMGMLSE